MKLLEYSMLRHCWTMISVTTLLMVLGGCGGDATKLSLQGTVTFLDRPIENGRIDFLPVDGTQGPSVGAPILSGNYTVDADQGVLAAGIYQVCIIAYRKTGRLEPNMINRGGPPVEVTENFIPPVYNTRSTLKVYVDDLPDKSKADFQLGK